MTAALVALGAGLGAAARFALSQRLDSRRWPWGIWVANVLGSAVLGVLMGLGVGDRAAAGLGIGFCGAFTTYSTFAVHTVDLGGRRGTAYAVSTVVLALAGCAAGFALGQAWA